MPPTAVEATAEVTIFAYMRTDEYMQEYADEVEWMQGEIYDPMIGVDFTSTVHVAFEVELSPEGDDAWITADTLSWVS